jgi:hypothetical protein
MQSRTTPTAAADTLRLSPNVRALTLDRASALGHRTVTVRMLIMNNSGELGFFAQMLTA